jgi:signal transduction histidine kinase/HD-like signal output (HDOD) protein
MSEQLQARRVELILRQLDQLPTLPAVALRVLEATSNSEASLVQIAHAIGDDPALTARILQLVHRADAGVAQELISIERAVILLGFDAVRSAVLSVCVFETIESAGGGSHPSGGFSREEFWKHSVAVACAAELLAETLIAVQGKPASVSGGEAFVCGLLHDVGKAALDVMLPKSFAKVVEATDLLRANIADLERNVIGLDHMIVGKRLAEHWSLPPVLTEAIWLHGQPPRALPEGIHSARMVNLITLADLIAREQHLGYSGNYVFDIDRQALLAAVGLSAQDVEAILTPLLERIELRGAALNLNVGSGDLYRQAMKRANQELGKVSTQLAMKNRRLAMRSRFFDLLGSFQCELCPEAGVHTVLEAVARSAAGVLDRCVAAFSFAPAREFAEAILVNEKGEPFETTLADCPADGAPGLPPSPASDGPVLPAGDELEWLIASIGPRLPGERRFWICLSAESRWVGGVVWGAPPGEAQRLGPLAQELTALAGAWQWALRTAQIRDESRRLSEQLAQANRELAASHADLERGRLMLSIAEMAAGAAHEMNNPLAVIAGRAQLLAAELADPRQQGSAKLITEQSDRLSRIITELMDYAQPSPSAIGPCDADELIARAVEQAKARDDMADRRVEVAIDQVPRLFVDFRQVVSALAEVIDNALLATRENDGRVDVSAAYDAVSRRVAITVSDQGTGMDEYTLKRAFDPFFSSKPAGRRRGLGLAKALRWLQGSGGTMKLESRQWRGTRAVILLPAAGMQSAADSETRKTPGRKTAF